MFTIKRRLGWSAALGLLVATFGVSVIGMGASSAASAQTASAHKLKSILFVNPLPDQYQWAEIGRCMQAQAKSDGVPYTEAAVTAAPTAVQMVQEIQTGIAEKVGAIVTFPESPAFIPVLASAKKAGIITGTMYGGGGSAIGEFNTGTDWSALGAAYAKTVGQRKGQQNVGLMAAAPTGDGLAFTDAFKQAAKTYPNITVVTTIYTNDDPATAGSEVSTLLLAHPNVNILATNMSTATEPVIADVKSAHDVGKVVLVALGGGAGALQGAQEGIVYRMLLQNLCVEGAQAAQAAVNVAAGKPGPAQINVQFAFAGLSNYQTYTSKGWS